MSGVKIQLSPKEQEMIANSGIILTKNRILVAVMELFGAVSEAEAIYLEDHRSRLPQDVFRFAPKISKGENYRQLPWLMLDNPRVFDPGQSLAVRHFFWWGNFFSIGIQVSGGFKEKLLQQIPAWPTDAYICVQASPWEHHFGRDNFLPLAELDVKEIEVIAGRQEFLKLAMALPVSQWESSPTFLLNGFTSYLDLLLD
jgi:hypothetical protein